jgi:hypothetical protein
MVMPTSFLPIKCGAFSRSPSRWGVRKYVPLPLTVVQRSMFPARTQRAKIISNCNLFIIKFIAPLVVGMLGTTVRFFMNK